ncbi:MAG: 1-acyl-sn-glycerol-3-phosphate acyltransferase [Oligoflexia bacterium]|nr:1-acyl-sn-glycerol-3-phosphate acyltransferase [Oligoflexia bacterium]
MTTVHGTGGSHPTIRFEQRAPVEGRLHDFERVRLRVLADVVARTQERFARAPLDMLLGEALYLENVRLKREEANLFTRRRLKGDRELWGAVRAGLLQSPVTADRKALLRSVVKHYAEEIGGHFNPKLYRFATGAVPWGFSWLLNAASVRRFLPWGMTQSLESRLRIVGEVPALQRLAQQGTILLVPTHQSNIDSMLIGYVIYLMSLPPFSYGAGLNLFSNPALSFFMNGLGAYTVDRKKSNVIYKETLKNYSTRLLREGVHSIFFPGGGRSRSGAIESRLKLGLLGTALEAQIQNLQQRSEKPNIYVVPMVMSYHFVLEAASLIEDYLAEAGKHRFIITDDESWQPTKILSFFWKLFSSQSGITVRIGKPLDVFGNYVDEEGRSLGPNGTYLDARRLLTTEGELKAVPQRDQEYTRELGARLTERFHRENTALTSHVVAFAFFETLRRKYPELDLFRFLRLSVAQRSLPMEEFLAQAERYRQKLLEAADRGELFLSDELRTQELRAWVEDGVRQLGLLHDAGVVRIQGGAIWSEDMTLLYYYRNRLAGYGLSLLAEGGEMTGKPGQNDSKGFLA